MLECANNFAGFSFGEQIEAIYTSVYPKGMYSEEGPSLQSVPSNSFPEHPPDKLFNESHVTGSPKYSNSAKSSYANYSSIPEKNPNWNYNLHQGFSPRTQSYHASVTTGNEPSNWISRSRKSSFSPSQNDALPDAGQRVCKKAATFSDHGTKLIKQDPHAILAENGRSLETPTVSRLISRNAERVAPLPNEISPDVRHTAISIGGEPAAQTQICRFIRQPTETTTCGSTNPGLPNFGYATPHNFPAASLHLDGSNIGQEGILFGSSKCHDKVHLS